MASYGVQLKDKNNNKCYPNPYWPIGSIFLSMNNTNPSTYFGGTWQLIGQGRTLVGVDASQTEFNTVNKTGGAKTHTLTVNEMPSHSHEGLLWGGTYGITLNDGNTNSYRLNWIGGAYNYAGGNDYQNIKTAYAGGGGAHNNLQPYLTCYIWNRIS